MIVLLLLPKSFDRVKLLASVRQALDIRR